MSDRADSVVVLDFETTGLSPDYGDRAIEVGAVRIESGKVVERFQGLMNPGMRISPFIEEYTGITNTMLAHAPACAEVMAELRSFIRDSAIVAHNSSFDRRFLEAEWRWIKAPCTNPFACSMLTARRIYPDAPNHKLGTLVAYKQINNDGVFHRALADAEMTGRLWLQMLRDIERMYGVGDMRFSTMQALIKVPKASVSGFFSRLAE